jgi:hypothetical protein
VKRFRLMFFTVLPLLLCVLSAMMWVGNCFSGHSIASAAVFKSR